jgi:carboxymethylenebutenolidase
VAQRAARIDAARMKTQWIVIPTDDGPMEGYLAEPDGGGPYPGVIVWQEAFGVNEYVRSVADRLADEGYVALAPELFHRSGKHLDIGYTDREKIMPLLGAIDNAAIATDARAAAHALRSRTEVNPDMLGVVGFCVGGLSALITGLATDVKSVVAFYPGGVMHARPGMKLTPIAGQLRDLEAETLVLVGDDDQGIPAAEIEGIRAALAPAKRKHEVVVYPGAKHGFHSQDRHDVYHPHAAEQAWHATLAWFGRTLGGLPSAV